MNIIKSNLLEEEMEDMEDLVAVVAVVCNNNAAIIASIEEEESEPKVDHRTLPRSSRTTWRHAEALHCINRDHLGILGDPRTPLAGIEFTDHFRISRTRFRLIMEDVRNRGIPFYQCNVAVDGAKGASLEARLLLPLKTLAYGVPAHTFQDYFQMSKSLCSSCCAHFDEAIATIYKEEYMRVPTAKDVAGIFKLHKKKHKVNGVFGSLDCMHTFWKNCPKAWAGSHKGKEKSPSIALEAICDYNLWFWHASCGYAGTLNDLNILSLSPLLKALSDGSFAELEKKANTVPHTMSSEEFDKLFILVDGIYPPHCRFVKGFPEPLSEMEKAFTKWQESARKDIERAFGVLQSKFKFMCNPINLHQLADISKRVTTCLILHNMSVAERIMGDCTTRYNPMQEQLGNDDANNPLPRKLQKILDSVDRGDSGAIGVDKIPLEARKASIDREIWKELQSIEEHNRLIVALMEFSMLRLHHE